MAAVWSSAKIIEVDFGGIEAVVMGWCMNAPAYIRLAKLGIHAYLASYLLNRPADLSWPDADLGQYFKEIKKSDDVETAATYARAKRVIHGSAYGLTVYGMCRNYPKTFPTLQSAQAVQQVYFDIAPEVPTFHTVVRHTAHETHKLGGAPPYVYTPKALKVSGHPYGYQHWFWSVVGYQRLTESQRLWHLKRHSPILDFNGIAYTVKLGEDAKRAVAFHPQSIARGVLTEASMPLFSRDEPLSDRCYIGDCYYGETPLRAPIHDSFLLEVPTRMVDRVIERVAYAMQRPMEDLPCPVEWGLGAALTIGVDAKIGDDWGAMAGVSLPSLGDLGVANDTPYTPAEDEDEEDVLDLETRL